MPLRVGRDRLNQARLPAAGRAVQQQPELLRKSADPELPAAKAEILKQLQQRRLLGEVEGPAEDAP